LDCISLSGLVFIVGAYGSGKSEIAIHLAALHAKKGKKVQLIDMDLVNLYFRTREAREELQNIGVKVVLPDVEYMDADLPIVSPKVLGAFQNPGDLTLVDVGGDPVGATVLASLLYVLKKQPFEVFQVVNPFRPFTTSTAATMRFALEDASHLKVTGLIANPNLLEDTTLEAVQQGAQMMSDISNELHLPCKFIAISEEFKNDFVNNTFSYPVLFLQRYLVPPWLSSGKL